MIPEISSFNYTNILTYPKDRFKSKFEFDFDEQVKYLRVDIGLSQEASYGAIWLRDHDDRGVIGIEPHPYNISTILGGGPKNRHLPHFNLNQNLIIENNRDVKNINGRYILVQGAADNVESPTTKTFYSATPDTGNSSLIQSNIDNQFNPNTIAGSFTIPVFPMTYIFDKIDWDKFKYIEQMKIDTEGNEIPILISCKHYLERVIFLRVECWEAGIGATQEDTATPMVEFLKEKGFENINQRPGDYKFVNIRYLDEVKRFDLECEEIL